MVTLKLYYRQLAWLRTKQKDAKEIRGKTVFNPKMPECGKLFYLVKDLEKIGYFGSNDSPIRDQEIYYFAKLNNIKYKPFEVDILKQCAQFYFSAYYEFNNTIDLAPYLPQETQEEIDARDDAMLAKFKKRTKK